MNCAVETVDETIRAGGPARAAAGGPPTINARGATPAQGM